MHPLHDYVAKQVSDKLKARRILVWYDALIPIENKRNFLDVSADIMEHVDPVFFSDPRTAALKVLGAA